MASGLHPTDDRREGVPQSDPNQVALLQVFAENPTLWEYVEEGKPFPRAACVIDVLRNSVAFDSAGQILAAFDALTQHEGLQLTAKHDLLPYWIFAWARLFI